MKRIVLLTIMSFAVTMATAQMSSVEYQLNSVGVMPSQENFLNPERGFYVQRSASASDVPLQPLIEGDLIWIRNTFEVSLVLRLYFLDAFTDGPISDAFLQMIKDDAVTLRKQGMKMILRFAYNAGQGYQHGHPYDANYDRVLAHIAQLKEDVFPEISDVIAVVQAGFIGTWGEWAYADESFYEGAAVDGVKDVSKLQGVTNALLDALPPDRMIQVRTPDYKIRMYNTGTGAVNALQEPDAYGGTAPARIGHHNDCFVASYNDYFTYVDPTNEYPYLAQDSRFLPVGGETCTPINTDNRDDCSDSGGVADKELELFHWSYLNVAWHPDILADWKTQYTEEPLFGLSCYDEIQRRLGYRFELQHGTYGPTNIDANCPLSVNIVLKNRGYASPYNPRAVELVLVNRANPLETYAIELEDQDPRYWFAELPEITINTQVTIPSAATDGTYDLYLHLPDPRPTLRGNPAYSIRLANTGVWQGSTGYNDLKQSITISSTGNTAPLAGTITAPIDPRPVDLQIDVEAGFTNACDGDQITAIWNWGDGNTSAGIVDKQQNQVAGSHTYTEAGVYTLTLTVTDEYGRTDSETFEYVVIYDPSAGFVTGGGWIDSPAGACPDFCGDATGKANFGFVSKYKRGATVPSGNTQFQFKAGDLNFQSTDYEWLVIAGAKAMFKGNGIINGGGAYSFQLNAIDGQISGGGGEDKFRIKIKDANDLVIYDNQYSADDLADPTTVLSGGSIKIHQKGGGGAKAVINSDLPDSGLPGLVLEQNLPNPFSRSTIIPFSLPRSAPVTLRLYDTSGRLVMTLAQGEYGPGRHQVELQDDQLRPGIYFYRLLAMGHQQTRRLVVLE